MAFEDDDLLYEIAQYDKALKAVDAKWEAMRLESDKNLQVNIRELSDKRSRFPRFFHAIGFPISRLYYKVVRGRGAKSGKLIKWKGKRL